MEQNEEITMGISTSGICLIIGTSFVNSLVITLNIWRRIVDESKQVGSKRTSEYSGQNKFTRLVSSLIQYTLGLTVGISQSSLCLIIHLLRSIIREAFVV